MFLIGIYISRKITTEPYISLTGKIIRCKKSVILYTEVFDICNAYVIFACAIIEGNLIKISILGLVIT